MALNRFINIVKTYTITLSVGELALVDDCYSHNMTACETGKRIISFR